jgi:hypothetical protein
MHTPKRYDHCLTIERATLLFMFIVRLLSGSDDTSTYVTNIGRRRSRSPNESVVTPIDDQIEQVAKRHRVPSDTVKRIVSVGESDRLLP